jgi:hypothetical protein
MSSRSGPCVAKISPIISSFSYLPGRHQIGRREDQSRLEAQTLGCKLCSSHASRLDVLLIVAAMCCCCLHSRGRGVQEAVPGLQSGRDHLSTLTRRRAKQDTATQMRKDNGFFVRLSQSILVVSQSVRVDRMLTAVTELPTAAVSDYSPHREPWRLCRSRPTGWAHRSTAQPHPGPACGQCAASAAPVRSSEVNNNRRQCHRCETGGP